MARGTEEKIRAAEEKVAKAKEKYDAAVAELKELEKKRDNEMKDALYDQLYRSDKSYDEIMAFLSNGEM